MTQISVKISILLSFHIQIPRFSTAALSSLSSSSESCESSSASDSCGDDMGELALVEVGEGGSEMGLEDDFQEIGPDGLKKVGWIRFQVSSNFSSSSLRWSDL